MACRTWFCLLALGLADASSACDSRGGHFMQEDWPFCVDLVPGILMCYGVSGDFLKLGLSVSPELNAGWSALAFGCNGGMKGAQQFVVRKVEGRFIAEERYAETFATPQLQPVQEVQLIFASEQSGHIEWGTLLPRKSCAEGERYAIEDVVVMQWAIAKVAILRIRGIEQNVGHLDCEHFATVQTQIGDLGRGEQIHRKTAFASVKEKVVACPGVFDLKQLAPAGLDMDVKNHVAAVFREEDSSSLPYTVHHVILLWCEEGLHAHLEIMEQLMMPPGCTIWAGLGPGGRGWQTHTGPYSTWRLRDSSGLSFLLADRLRPHDAGLLTVIGAGPWSGSLGLPDLPPGRAHYTAPQVLAPSSCTREWNAEELTVFSVYHHAHSLSINMSLEVVRGSQKVGSVRQENRFDFDSQAFEMTSGSMKLRRGDELLLTCNEKNMSRTSPTKWGDLFDDEMCVISMTVYPAQVMSQVWFAEEGLVWCDGASHVWHNYSVSKIPLLSSPRCIARGSLISSEAIIGPA
ncbi:moxd2 [Symbiodinium sp. CCMP2592]|nr:moxd2 [Symbiodinium sp. CCMP2592]